MKNKQIIAILCTALALTVTGCQSTKADSDAASVGVVDFNNETDKEEQTVTEPDSILPNANPEQLPTDSVSPDANQAQLPTDSVSPDANQAQLPTNSTQTTNDNAQPQAELDGSIESIGDNSVVVNEIIHESEDVAVMVLDSKNLVSVSFGADTTFEVWTVKNGGVNGDADVEKRQGAFSDLEINTSLRMTGSYEGDTFHAKQVVIYHFV